MARQNITYFRDKFRQGLTPAQQDLYDLFDTMFGQDQDATDLATAWTNAAMTVFQAAPKVNVRAIKVGLTWQFQNNFNVASITEVNSTGFSSTYKLIRVTFVTPYDDVNYIAQTSLTGAGGLAPAAISGLTAAKIDLYGGWGAVGSVPNGTKFGLVCH